MLKDKILISVRLHLDLTRPESTGPEPWLAVEGHAKEPPSREKETPGSSRRVEWVSHHHNRHVLVPGPSQPLVAVSHKEIFASLPPHLQAGHALVTDEEQVDFCGFRMI